MINRDKVESDKAMTQHQVAGKSVEFNVPWTKKTNTTYIRDSFATISLEKKEINLPLRKKGVKLDLAWETGLRSWNYMNSKPTILPWETGLWSIESHELKTNKIIMQFTKGSEIMF